MKKIFLGTVLFALVITGSFSTTARAEVSVHISLPPPIVFSNPPELIVLPETYVYVVPDVDVDIFFYNGWWWRPWDGRWYRSRHHNSGWAYYQRVPTFYRGIPSGWRNDYRDHRWRGHQWSHQRIPHQQVERNWQGWKKSNHWEKQQTWGVQGLKPQTRAQQPARTVQPRVKEVKPEQPRQQHQEANPQSKKAVKQQKAKQQSRQEGQPYPSQQQKGDRDRGKSDKQDRR